MSTTVNLGMLPQNRGQFTTATWPQNISIYKDNIVQYNGSSYIYNPASFDIEHPEASATSLPPYSSTPATLNTGWAVFASGNNTFTTGQSVDELSIDAKLSHTSNGIPSSSEVFNKFIESGVFDLSAYNAVGGELATYADLNAALTAMNSLQAAYKKGGMSIKFVLTSDNNSTQYVQYRYMGTSTANADFVNTANWEPQNYNELDSIILNNFLIGDNNNLLMKEIYGLIPGHKYRVFFKNPNWDKTGVTVAGARLIIANRYNNTSTDFVRINDSNISKNYDITIPTNSDYIRIAIRATKGVRVEFSIDDITNSIEIHNTSFLAIYTNGYFNANNVTQKIEIPTFRWFAGGDTGIVTATELPYNWVYGYGQHAIVLADNGTSVNVIASTANIKENSRVVAYISQDSGNAILFYGDSTDPQSIGRWRINGETYLSKAEKSLNTKIGKLSGITTADAFPYSRRTSVGSSDEAVDGTRYNLAIGIPKGTTVEVQSDYGDGISVRGFTNVNSAYLYSRGLVQDYAISFAKDKVIGISNSDQILCIRWKNSDNSSITDAQIEQIKNSLTVNIISPGCIESNREDIGLSMTSSFNKRVLQHNGDSIEQSDSGNRLIVLYEVKRGDFIQVQSSEGTACGLWVDDYSAILGLGGTNIIQSITGGGYVTAYKEAYISQDGIVGCKLKNSDSSSITAQDKERLLKSLFVRITRPGTVGYNEATKNAPKEIPLSTMMQYSGKRISIEEKKNTLFLKKWANGIITGKVGSHSGQSVAIYNDYVFRLIDSGLCYIYQMTDAETISFVTSFDLGGKAVDNDLHCNSCQFDDHIIEGDFPYLYVSRNHYQTHCYVEKITPSGSTLVQKISASSELLAQYPALSTVSFNLQCGDDGYMYMVGGTGANITNPHIQIVKLRKPAISEGSTVELGVSDILDEWKYYGDYSYGNYVWQSMIIKNGLLYFVFGLANKPNGFWVFNISSHELVNKVDVTSMISSSDELEGFYIYNGYAYAVVYPGNYGYIMSF